MAAPLLSPAAERIVGTLKPYTPFAEAIVKRQAERAGLDVASLRDDQVERLAPMILAAAKMFLDPVQLAALKREIR